MTTHELCTIIIPFNIKRKSFSDLTGAFPHKSSREHFYAMVMYDYDSNEILAKPIKNRQSETVHDVFFRIHKVLKVRDSKQKVYIMDNDFSSYLKEAMEKYEIDFQLALSHMHRRNA